MASRCMLRLTLPCAQVAQAELRPCSSILRNADPRLRLKRQLLTSKQQNQRKKKLSLIYLVILDDNFAISCLTWLVSIAALVRHYSPSTHPLLRLLSHVFALGYYSALLYESCRLYTTLFRGTKSAPREPKQDPLQNTFF